MVPPSYRHFTVVGAVLVTLSACDRSNVLPENPPENPPATPPSLTIVSGKSHTTAVSNEALLTVTLRLSGGPPRAESDSVCAHPIGALGLEAVRPCVAPDEAGHAELHFHPGVRPREALAQITGKIGGQVVATDTVRAMITRGEPLSGFQTYWELELADSTFTLDLALTDRYENPIPFRVVAAGPVEVGSDDTADPASRTMVVRRERVQERGQRLILRMVDENDVHVGNVQVAVIGGGFVSYWRAVGLGVEPVWNYPGT